MKQLSKGGKLYSGLFPLLLDHEDALHLHGAVVGEGGQPHGAPRSHALLRPEHLGGGGDGRPLLRG